MFIRLILTFANDDYPMVRKFAAMSLKVNISQDQMYLAFG